MLKKTLKYIVIVAGIFSMFMVLSCNKDDDSSSTSEISIYYKDRVQEIEDDVTSTSIKFTAYTPWYVTIDSLYTKWLSVDSWAGSPGSFTITCKTEKNDSLESRTGYIVIHGETLSSQVTITQKGYQVIIFNDDQFERYCLDNFDLDQSGYVTSREAHLATEINCPNSEIGDFTGIEHFKNIEKIDISKNPVYTLSLAKSTKLNSIRCNHCTNLQGLELGTNMKKLTYLDFSYCNLTSINIDSCILLHEMNGKANDLKSLNIVSNKNLSIVDVSENFNMISIFVGEDQILTNLKKEESTRIVYPNEKLNIPDPEFRKYLLEQFDVNRDNQLDASEAEAVEYIRCHGQIGNPRPIYSMEGLQYFPNIVTLDCSYCMISELDLVYNPKLSSISCHNNDNLQSIKISALSPLEKFHCSNCKQLTSLNLNNNSHLVELYADNCNISDIDLSECRSLTYLQISHNSLTEINCEDCNKLNYIDCSYNIIAGTITVQDMDSLSFLFCQHNSIEAFDLDSEYLYDVDCGNNNLRGELNLADWKYLHTFACDSNGIASLTLPENTIMTMLDVRSNALENLDLTIVPKIQYVYAESNSLSEIKTEGCDGLERLNLRANNFEGEVSFSNNRGLKILWIDQNPSLTTLYVPKGLEQFEYKADEYVTVIER